jgi:hypothetical protein
MPPVYCDLLSFSQTHVAGPPISLDSRNCDVENQVKMLGSGPSFSGSGPLKTFGRLRCLSGSVKKHVKGKVSIVTLLDDALSLAFSASGR